MPATVSGGSLERLAMVLRRMRLPSRQDLAEQDLGGLLRLGMDST